MKSLAVFDFDGTLIRRDSLWPFLVGVAGFRKCVFAFFSTAAAYIFCRSTGEDPRSYIKSKLLEKTLEGIGEGSIAKTLPYLVSWCVWKKEVVDLLMKHHDKGHFVLIATGSLDIYIHELIKNLPVDAVLCTKMESVDGVLTGKMAGGNCVRIHKAELVKRFIEENGPFEETWSYGNAPHDLPMMALTDHSTIIKK